ncbi:MAG: IS21 family transposase, partial [Bacillales bacterium]|nr:IS21 family transposase [Bacillales bacterium]
MNMCISTTLAYFKLMNIKPNFSELSRQLGVDRHTLKKHFDAGGVKPRKKREYVSELDQYKNIIE